MAVNYKNEHPVYKERKEQWAYNAAFREGGKSIENYLTQFSLEGRASFTNRLKRSIKLYKNLPSAGLQVYSSQLFRIAPERKLPGRLKDMLTNCDRIGTDPQPFMADRVDTAQILGQSYVLVDSTRPLEGSTMAPRPYFEAIPTLNVIDWDIEVDDPDRYGEFNYIVIMDKIRVARGPFQEREEVSRFRVWSPDQWQILLQRDRDREPVIDSEGENAIGKVPLVPFFDRRTGPMVGSTIFDAVCRLSDAIWQYRSVRDEAIYYHGIWQLVYNGEKEIDSFDFGNARAIQIDPGEALSYLAPPQALMQFYAEVTDELKQDVTDLIYALTGRQLASAQVESAEKRQIDREEFVAILEAKAANFEEAETACWRLANAWAGGNYDETGLEVNYNRDFKELELAADEWMKQIEGGVSSRAEWFQSLHPGTSDEEAAAAVQANLAARGSAVRDALGGLRSRFSVSGEPQAQAVGVVP
jgi:hypothetical protein